MSDATSARSPDLSVASAVYRQRCVEVSHLCVVAEQLLLPAADNSQRERSLQQRRSLQRLLDGMHSPFDFHTRMQPRLRPTVITDSSNYTYIPLVVAHPPASRAELQKIAIQQTATALPPVQDDGLIFYTCWPDNAAEVFHRAVTLLHALWPLVSKPRAPTLVPAAWSNLFDYWLAPFAGTQRIQAMAPLPNGNGYAVNWARSARSIRKYAERAALLRAPPRCFARAHVCDFTKEGLVSGVDRAQPYEAMQLVMRHALSLQRGGPQQGAMAHGRRNKSVLRVGFVQRHGRRLFERLPQLIDSCNSWRLMEVHCSPISFARGLPSVARELRRLDVLISPHGADAVHGLALQPHAWFIEVMPVFGRANCPCDVFRALFDAEPRRVHYLRLTTTNESYAAFKGYRYKPNAVGSYVIAPPPDMHENLILPWAAVRHALQLIVVAKQRPHLYSRTSAAVGDAVRHTVLEGDAAGWRLLDSAGAADEEKGIRARYVSNIANARRKAAERRNRSAAVASRFRRPPRG